MESEQSTPIYMESFDKPQPSQHAARHGESLNIATTVLGGSGPPLFPPFQRLTA